MQEVASFSGNVTGLAKAVSDKHKIPLSTVWLNLHNLEEKGMIALSANPSLTQLGVIVARLAVDQKDGVQIPQLGLRNKKRGDKT